MTVDPDPDRSRSPWHNRKPPKPPPRLFRGLLIEPWVRGWERNRLERARRAQDRRLAVLAAVLAVAAAGIVGTLIYVEREFVGRTTVVVLEMAGIAVGPAGEDTVDRPLTGMVYNATGRRLEAPLRIVAPSGVDHFIKLVDFETGAEALAFYIRSGEPLEVMVPFGSYRLRHSFGTGWQGEESLFGRGLSTRLEEAVVSLDFGIVDGEVQGKRDFSPTYAADFLCRRL